MRLKISCAIWRPFCPGEDTLSSIVPTGWLDIGLMITRITENVTWSRGWVSCLRKKYTNYDTQELKLEMPWRLILAAILAMENVLEIFYSQSKFSMYTRSGLEKLKLILQLRHNGRDGVLNHRRRYCLLNRLFRHRSKKYQSAVSLAIVRGIHRWPVDIKKASNAENVSIWWRHHELNSICVRRSVISIMTVSQISDKLIYFS